jgi:hypothetical protein
MALPLRAQSSDYTPSHRLAEGRQIVAVYIGSTDCGPCQWPQVKEAVRKMKSLVAAQAAARGMTFRALGVAQDWDLKAGATFLEPLGAFDQVAIGDNWTNIGVEQYVLRDPVAEMAMPQIVILERTIKLGKRVTVTEPHVLKRIVGGEAIPAWVAAGASLPVTGSKAPE